MKYIDRKVGVLLGGMSAEREVSLATGAAVVTALKEKGYDVVEIDMHEGLAYELAQNGVQVVYIALHGKYGEDGCVQGMLEVMKIPYTGSSVIASAIAMDKKVSADIWSANGLPVPETVVLHADDAADFSLEDVEFGLPLIVKPATEGSSVGITIVKEIEQIDEALEEAFKYDDRVLLQRYIKGREISVAVLDGQALGTVEIKPKLEFYNYKAKYTKGMTVYLVPAPLDDDLSGEVMHLAQEANNIIGSEGSVRVDFIIDEEGTPYLIELNTLPGLTETSLVPKIAAQKGIEFNELVEMILDGARLKMGV